MQTLTLIAAVANNGCIGNSNDMPWHIPEDFAFFKRYTRGKPVVMGRKTWQSLPKKPLPERHNIVISRQPDFSAAGASVVPHIDAALALCADAPEIVIIGGAQIYVQTLPFATDLRLTEVDLTVEGDAFFPPFDAAEWHRIAYDEQVSAKGIRFALVHYQKDLPSDWPRQECPLQD